MFFQCPEFSQFHLKSGWMKGWQLLELEGFMMLYWQINWQTWDAETCCNWKCPVNAPQKLPIFTPGVPVWQSPNKFRQNHQGLQLVSTLQYQLWSSKNQPNIPPHNQISLIPVTLARQRANGSFGLWDNMLATCFAPTSPMRFIEAFNCVTSQRVG